MAARIGELMSKGWGIETTYGTEVAGSRSFGFVQDFTDSPERNVVEIRGATNYEPGELVALDHSTKGSMDIILNEGALFRSAFNTLTTTGSPNYVHTLIISGTTALPSATYVTSNKEATAFVKVFPGVMLTKLSISVDAKDVLHAKTDWVAKTIKVSGAAPAVVISSSRPYVYTDGAITVGADVVSEIGNVEIVNNYTVDQQWYQASGGVGVTPTDTTMLNVGYEGNLTLSQQSGTQYQRFLGFTTAIEPAKNGSQFNVDVKYERSATDYIRVVDSGCLLTTPAPDGGLDATLFYKLAYRAKNRTVIVANTGSPL